MPGLTFSELDRLTSELNSFARSKVPMPEGLEQLSRSLSSGKLKQLSHELATATGNGVPLSRALQDASVKIPPAFTAMVRCGEMTGNMTQMLNYAMENARRIRNHRSALTTMFVYPTVVFLVFFILLLFLFTWVAPHFKDIYKQLGAELPGATAWIINMSDFATGGGAAIIPLLILFCCYVVYLALREKLPDWLLSNLPGMRRLVALSDTSAMTEAMAHLLENGVPLPDACRAAALTVTQRDMRVSLERMALVAEKGGASADQLDPGMPATAAWLYRQGETRGTLAEACLGISSYCDSRFEIVSRRALFALEPLFIVLISLFIGFVTVSFYLPLFNIPKIVV